MKKLAFIALTAIITLCFAGVAGAGESATKEECVAKVKEAAALAEKEGLDAAVKKIQDKNSGFVWKDTYVFCQNIETGVIVAHPIKPKLVGKMLKGLKDINGKMFVIEYINMAKDKGEGWVDYMWPKPGEKESSLKTTYVYKVPGQNVLMGAGIYK